MTASKASDFIAGLHGLQCYIHWRFRTHIDDIAQVLCMKVPRKVCLSCVLPDRLPDKSTIRQIWKNRWYQLLHCYAHGRLRQRQSHSLSYRCFWSKSGECSGVLLSIKLPIDNGRITVCISSLRMVLRRTGIRSGHPSLPNGSFSEPDKSFRSWSPTTFSAMLYRHTWYQDREPYMSD